MRRYSKLNPQRTVAAGIAVVAVLIMVLAMVDWYVMTIVNPAYSYSTVDEMATFNTHYWFWLGALMIMFGFACAALIKVAYAYSPISNYLAGMVVATDIILVIAGFEDDMFFLLGQHGFPSNSVQWNWMYEYKIFGFWTTTNQIEWGIFWILIVLPITIGVSWKAMQKYKRKRFFVRFA